MLDAKASAFFKILERSLSSTRFNGYKMQGGDEKEALSKYLWNMALCESLCPCFQILEVDFRNTLHDEISRAVKVSNWILNETGFLREDEKEAIKKAKSSATLSGRPVTEDILIAEMKFGFWTSLLDSRYELLWHKIITGVFPHMPKTMRTRGDASKLMHTVRRLRNAALHHHSIWHWRDLKDQHAQMRKLISYICTSSSAVVEQIDRFTKVYDAGPNQFQQSVLNCINSNQATT